MIFRFCPLLALCGRRSGEEDETLQVVDEVFHSDICSGADDADGTHELSAHLRLPTEGVLDAGADF